MFSILTDQTSFKVEEIKIINGGQVCSGAKKQFLAAKQCHSAAEVWAMTGFS